MTAILISISLDISSIFGIIASLLIGLSLGLIGGGGSILTVPVLVYLFSVDPLQATAYSLFIVGATSAVGAFPKYKEGQVNLKTALIFGAPSIITVFATRKWIVPAIPAQLGQWGDFVLTKSVLLMLLFALLMVAASFSMISTQKSLGTPELKAQSFNYPLILIEGAVVGILTGLVGAGGGFLIIPALVLLTGLPMKQAVGTSLLIIAAKSLIGFIGDLSEQQIDWSLLGFVTAMAVMGIFIGNQLSKKIDGNKLKKGFGWFVLVMGIYILL
ncbi:MAG: sulfite exporter TauE/SafE family protein, partial [Bacteroidetes bacterium]|nr:sulfite exporter TauE/SafE family protein [Bacteroidota bacterium]